MARNGLQPGGSATPGRLNVLRPPRQLHTSINAPTEQWLRSLVQLWWRAVDHPRLEKVYIVRVQLFD
jgi:hypothetical protein